MYSYTMSTNTILAILDLEVDFGDIRFLKCAKNQKNGHLVHGNPVFRIFEIDFPKNPVLGPNQPKWCL